MFHLVFNIAKNWIRYPKALASLDKYPSLRMQLISARACNNPTETLTYALNQSRRNGIALEFGVYTGGSLRIITKFFPNETFGFDSFEGLPENWREGFSKGHFSLTNLPVIDNANLIVGLFKNTLETFLEENKKKISFIHLDADLYSSTSFVLEKLNPFIESGCIIVFDELIHYPGFEEHELKSLLEFQEKHSRKLKPIAFTSWHEQVAFKVIR
jgi:hypothetical protein